MAVIPSYSTATNFARSVPFAIIVSLVMLPYFEISLRGIWLAIISGGYYLRIGLRSLVRRTEWVNYDAGCSCPALKI